MKEEEFDPNGEETEEDAIRCEAIRRLKVNKLISESLGKSDKSTIEIKKKELKSKKNTPTNQ